MLGGRSWKHIFRPEGFGSGKEQNARLPDAVVIEGLQQAKSNKWVARELAEYLGIGLSTASAILAGRSYKHLPRP